MRKFDFKTRLQWGWFKAALIGTAFVILIAPAAGGALGIKNTQKTEEENPILSVLSSISFGNKVKVIINGDVVALAKSEEAGKEAFMAARLAYNATGIKLLDVEVAYEEVNKEKDADTIKGMRLLRDEKLSNAIFKSFDQYTQKEKELAYVMRIDDYTVTVDNMEDLVAILEQAQSKYDVADTFQVELNPPSSRNVTMYEIAVTEKAVETAGETTEGTTTAPEGGSETTEGTTTAPEGGSETTEGTTTAPEGGSETTEGTTTAPEGGSEALVIPIAENQRRLLTGAEATTEQTAAPEEGETGTTEQSEIPEAGAEVTTEAPADTATPSQAANDGIKYVGFSEKIQVMETYVSKDQIKDKDTAYYEITAEKDEASIYVVEPGDCLSIIAEKNNLSVEQIKELNPSIESDDDIYYDDRLHITVPRAAVQILVEKQETYKENYNEDMVYEDDGSMYIGETEVVQEGSPGTHTVTDLVTYKNDMEYDREQLQETVEVAAVAQVVKRGTKSKPTYMLPVTNWNITSTFGYRWGRLHAGVDVGIPIGTTVRASRSGQVITSGWLGGYGNCVIIDHGDGISTRYGHLNEVTVSVGQYVDQGQQIALSGNTGRSTGPHLHFEIRVGGEAVDPLPYLN